MKPCVYFMRACFRSKVGKQTVGFVHWKIGHTLNVDRRRAAFQTACPVPIDVIGTLACESRLHASALEGELHRYFRDCRVQGEWFNFTIRQAKAIELLIKAWPTKLGATSFLDSLPYDIPIEMDASLEKALFVPIGALHEARMEIKQLREQIRESAIRVSLVSNAA